MKDKHEIAGSVATGRESQGLFADAGSIHKKEKWCTRSSIKSRGGSDQTESRNSEARYQKARRPVTPTEIEVYLLDNSRNEDGIRDESGR